MSKLNNLSIEFFRVYNKSLTDVLAVIITASLTFKYFSLRFYCAEIVVLIKSEKISKVLYTLKVYKFIILLNFINKIIKKIINERIVAAAEKHNLLSQNQMKNYLRCLIKFAI